MGLGSIVPSINLNKKRENQIVDPKVYIRIHVSNGFGSNPSRVDLNHLPTTINTNISLNLSNGGASNPPRVDRTIFLQLSIVKLVQMISNLIFFRKNSNSRSYKYNYLYSGTLPKL